MFNIQEVVRLIQKFLLSSYTTNLPAITDAVTGYVLDAEERLKNLAKGAASGELTYKFVVLRLEEEKTNLKDQLLSIEQMIGADIQVLINKVVGIFETAVRGTITNLQDL